MSMQAPHLPHYTEGTGNTIIIINTDGKPDIKHILGNHHDKKHHIFHGKHMKHPMMKKGSRPAKSENNESSEPQE